MCTVLWIPLMPMLTLALSTPLERADAEPTERATGFLYKTVTIGAETYAYCVYVPPEYTPDEPWPAILFLHGSGERGSDGFRQTDVGVARAIRRNRKLVPAIVVMPQCRRDKTWTGDMTRMALRCVEKTSQEYHLDSQRLYLTGLSLGGAGAWTIAAALPGRFAAIAPLCGFGNVRDAEKLTATPIWCTHGALDKRVPVARSREMVKAVRDAGGSVTYKEYPAGAHNVWDRTYSEREFWRWLFAQRLAPADEPAERDRENKRQSDDGP